VAGPSHWPRHTISAGRWSLTSLQQRLVKTGGRLIKHARYYWLLLGESQLTRLLFGHAKVAALPSPAGYGACRAQQILGDQIGGGKGISV
jgi:hypothetical protein